jgi:aspartate/methionine/tyrosine aminotransferase
MSLRDIDDFALERWFARWEFSVAHQLSASDVEPLRMRELLALADADAKERWDHLALGYTEPAGLTALREAIADQYPGLTADDVFVLAGAEEGIFLLCNAALRAGDDCVVVTPAYQSLTSVPTSLGARVIRVELRADRAWELDAEDVARAVTPRTRLIAINFPHNPTGAHISAETQRRLVEIADGAGATLFSDEVYHGLEHAAETLPPAASLSPRAVSLGVVSKAYALAGLRIGWIATRDAALISGIARLKDYTTICSSAPSEVLALMAVRARAKLLERSRAIVADNVRRARDFIARFARDVEWVPPRAGSTAFPRFTTRDADAVAQRLATHERVLMLPGSLFAADRAHFRLGLGRRDFPEALKALEKVLLEKGERRA